MACSREKSVQLLRQLYRELRLINTAPVRKTLAWKYVVLLNRGDVKNNTSKDVSENLLRAGEHYLNCLRSTREYYSIMTMFKGKGERSAEEMAKLMGFSMPDQPRQPRRGAPETKSLD